MRKMKIFSVNPEYFEEEIPPKPTDAQILTRMEEYLGCEVIVTGVKSAAYILKNEKIHVHTRPYITIEDGIAVWVVSHTYKVYKYGDIPVSEKKPTKLVSVKMNDEGNYYYTYTPHIEYARKLIDLNKKIDDLYTKRAQLLEHVENANEKV